MPRPKGRRIVSSLRAVGSAELTPATSASPSATPSLSRSTYPSEDEDEAPRKFRPFRFLDLPSELRNKIYGHAFNLAPHILDLDPDNFRTIHRKMSIFLVSKQIHDEASHNFYSTNTIRLFPCHPGRFFKTKKPLLARLPSHYRASISSLELRLGPGFANPPRGWVVNEALGLRDCINARILKVMVQIDTSNPVFEGFRSSDDGFYERFSKALLDDALSSLPSIINIEFDAWSSVMKDGPMMRALLDVAYKHNLMVSWGPERGWKDEKNEEWMDKLITKAALVEALPEISLVA